MKSLFEWIREDPDYVKKKRKEELRGQISERQVRLNHLNMMRGPTAVQRDMRDPEDARWIDRLNAEIAPLKEELKKLESAD